MSEIIRVENLSYIYNQGMPDETKALDDVSFTVEEGDFVGIIGSTGSGKSTLISHFNGLNRPTSGRVLVDGRDLWEQGADLRSFRFLVGLVMQYPEYQLFEETCARDIAYGPRNMGLDEEEVQRRVREAAAFVGLSDELLQKSPFELSGGQKRRVAIAGVMAMHPRVLVLDEPAAPRPRGPRHHPEPDQGLPRKDRHHGPAGQPLDGGYCQVRQPRSGHAPRQDRHVRHGGKGLCPRTAAT